MLSLILLIVAPVAAPVPVPLNDQIEIRKYVGAKLLDSESARWKWPLKQPGFGIYCGWVNAKNSYGAYTGFAPYLFQGGRSSTGYFIPGEVTIADGDPESIDSRIVYRFCTEKGYDLSEPPIE